uniref:Uncharacterized protein n=1 Tax=Anguilla anguilla TaxID=7936 RepID=A0A0E9T5A1_ANGAN
MTSPPTHKQTHKHINAMNFFLKDETH